MEASMASGERRLVFRPAVAADVDAAVPLIYSSGPAAFNYVFGRDDAMAFLRRAFAASDGEFSHRTHVVVEDDGQVVAAGAAFDGRRMLAFTLAAARQILSHYGPVRAVGVIVRGLRTESVIRPPKARECYIAHLGVAPNLRGGGIGAQLVRHLLGRVDPALHDCAALDVAATNPRAEALYARLGFRSEVLRKSCLANEDGAVPDHWRMALPSDMAGDASGNARR